MTERSYVNQIAQALENYYDMKIFINVDRDSPYRKFKSGYDFLISKDDITIFFEAKKSKNKSKGKKIYNDLTDYQILTLSKIAYANSNPFILEFVEKSELKEINLFYFLDSKIIFIKSYKSIENFCSDIFNEIANVKTIYQGNKYNMM